MHQMAYYGKGKTIYNSGQMEWNYHTVDDRYVFNITTFVQNYLEGKIDTPSVELFLPLTAEQNVIFKANGNEPTITFDFAYTIY